MFLGIDYSGNKEIEKQLAQEKAKKRLAELQLCDICELEQFNCDYEVNLYKLDQNDYPELVLQYVRKIPIIGEKSLERLKNESIYSRTASYSLGFAMKIVKKELSKLCDLSRKQKKLKKFNKKCCERIFEF